MMPGKKGPAALIVDIESKKAPGPKDPMGDMDDAGGHEEYDTDSQAAMEAFMDALHSNDPQSAIEAFKSLMDVCG
jgi:hypothetical protein